ncbi:MAG: esterase-like activity of phytase family protein [Myxococcota bacterium]
MVEAHRALRGIAAALLLPLSWASTASEAQAAPVRLEQISDEPQLILSEQDEELGLSDITWLGGDRYLAVGDREGKLYFLRIPIDADTGAIQQVELERIQVLAGARDLEAVIQHPERRTCFVTDEAPDDDQPVREHDCSDGRLISAFAPTERADRLRRNTGLEGLTYDGSVDALFAASEGPLRGDGPAPTERAGAWARVFAFGAAGEPIAEWAYHVDATPGDVPLFDRELNGIAALAALGDGRLLVLERGLGAQGILGLPGFRHRIYLVTPTSGSECSGADSLPSDGVAAMPKRLLWEGSFGPAFNFEGITFGPALSDASRLLLLVSDDGAGLGRAVLPLRVSHGEPTA